MRSGLDDSRLMKVVVTPRQGDYRVGTAYAVRPTLLLTARHVIQGRAGQAPAARVEVALPEGGWREVRVAWESEPLDGCLLALPEPLPLRGTLAWGEFTRSQRVEWESCGFPRAASFEEERKRVRDTADVYGTLGPHGGRERGQYELVITAGAPLSAEAWGGLSGGPIFGEGRLIGIICSSPGEFAGARLYGMPVARLLEDAGFREAVGAPMLQPVPRPVPRFLQDNIQEPRGDVRAPGALLTAMSRVVPFQQEVRQEELASLTAWCEDSAPLGVRLFTGAGGAGKTRLFIEWCSWLRAKGWQAGFLPGAAQFSQTRFEERLEELLGGSEPVFLVVDEAEARPRLRDDLAFIQGRLEGAPEVRVALVARQEGDWWTWLREREELSALLAEEPFPLRPLPEGGNLRVRAFETAREAFAARLQTGSVSSEVSDLSDRQYASILFIHMEALVAVEQRGLRDARAAAKPLEPRDALVDVILGREQDFWADLARLPESDPKRSRFLRDARRGVAALTLKGGAADVEEAEAALEAARAPDGDFLETLGWMYPGSGSAGANDCYLRGLEPSVLGERLVERVLLERETAKDYLERVFEGASEEAVKTGFLLLGRLSLRKPEEARPWLERLLKQDVRGRAKAALVAVLALGQKSAFVSLGSVLAEGLKQEGTPELARELEGLLPRNTVSLRDVAVWVTEERLKQLPEGVDVPTRSERARLFNNLGNRLSEVGRREESLAATEEAVKHYRELARLHPEAFLPDLAMSLNNLGTGLGEVERQEEALAALEEAVKLRRELARQRPDAFLPGLAMSLSNLGHRLSEVGRREEALAVAQEAVKHYRELARQHPEAFLPNLAASLHNLSFCWGQVGRREEALAATEEAVKLRRELARQRPDAFLPDLAKSLTSLGTCLSEVGRREEALAVAVEAVKHYRELARQHPEAFLLDFASSLNNLGIWLGKLERREEALAASEEAVKHYRELVRQHPEPFLPDLAMGLTNLGNRFSDVGRKEEALAAAEEAVAHYRTLARQRPEAFLPDLALGLSNLGNQLGAVGRREEARAASEEAVRHYRELAQRRPEAFLPGLAMSLTNLGNRLAALERWEEALAASAEAVKDYRELARQHPEAFFPDLALSLTNQCGMLSKMGRREVALAEEVVKLYRELARQGPETFLPGLARNLNILSRWLGEEERWAEALAVAQEAVKHLRELARVHPEAFLPDLANSLKNLDAGLSGVGRGEEALAATEEVVKLYRELARQHPGSFRLDLILSVNLLGVRLSEVGRWEEALAATEEGVRLYRELVQQKGPESILDGFAMSLASLAFQLGAVGRREEALAPMEEAIGLFRELARQHPEGFLPYLAMSLGSRGLHLGALGRREEAVAALEEAVRHYRELARQRPEAFLPDLATILEALGVVLRDMGRTEEASAAMEEAMSIRRAQEPPSPGEPSPPSAPA